MSSRSQGNQNLAGAPGTPQSSRLRRLRALVALAIILAGLQSAAALGQRPPASRQLDAPCTNTTRRPQTVVRAWLSSYVRGTPLSCRLSAASYHASEPPFDRYRVALACLLRRESQPGHRLYL